MVGQDNEVVRPGRRIGRCRDARDLAVEPAQHGEGVNTLDARVMGDLVIGQEGRVPHGSSGVEITDDRCDLQVTLDDGAQARTSA